MNKIRRNPWVSHLCFIFVVLCFSGNAKSAVLENNDGHAKELAEKYQIPETTVVEMRDQNQGWGEVETQLALAERLSQKDPVTYPEFTDALNRVEAMRDEGKGYGQIAHELGFNLGDIVSESKKASPQKEMAEGDEERKSPDFVKENRDDAKALRESGKDAMKEAKENSKASRDAAKEIGREARENAKSSREAAKEAKDSAKALRDAVKEAKKEAKEHGKSKKS